MQIHELPGSLVVALLKRKVLLRHVVIDRQRRRRSCHNATDRAADHILVVFEDLAETLPARLAVPRRVAQKIGKAHVVAAVVQP